MRQTPLILAMGVACGLCATASLADTSEKSVSQMQQQILDLKQQLAEQKRLAKENQAKIEQLHNAYTPYFQDYETEHQDSNTQQEAMDVEVSGLIEIQAIHAAKDGEEDKSDIKLSTAKIGVSAKMNEWVSGDLVALYEESTDNEGDYNMDVAKLKVADPDANWFMYAGQYTLPFGSYSTNMITGTLTSDFAETKDSAIEVGIGYESIEASVFVFQGNYTDTIDNYGVGLNTSHEIADDHRLSFHLGYLNNLLESNRVVNGGWAQSDQDVPGWMLAAQYDSDLFSLIGGYAAAGKKVVDAGNEKPSAYHLEGVWHTQAFAKPADFALAYQASQDAQHENWSLAEERALTAFSIELQKNMKLALEYKHEADYSGVEADTLTSRLSVGF